MLVSNFLLEKELGRVNVLEKLALLCTYWYLRLCQKHLERMEISKYKKVHSFYRFYVENKNRTHCILQSVNSTWENAHTILISTKLFWLFFDGCLLREISFEGRRNIKKKGNNLYSELYCTHIFYLKTVKNILKYHGLWSQRKDVEMLEFFRQSYAFFKKISNKLHNLSGFLLSFFSDQIFIWRNCSSPKS